VTNKLVGERMGKRVLLVGLSWIFSTQISSAGVLLFGHLEYNEFPAIVSGTEKGHRKQRSKCEGRIGVRIASNGKIDRVHPQSPAEQAGLQPKDVVKSVDGKRNNIDNISGVPGSYVHLVVERNDNLFDIAIQRVEFTDFMASKDVN
jgi:predicted metalloprotease with PDZ domain